MNETASIPRKLDPCYLPVFDDFREVFATYPYARVVDLQGDSYLGLGYAVGPAYSKVHGLQGERVRRNCAITTWDEFGEDGKEVHFSKLRNASLVLEIREGAHAKYIRLIPLSPGTLIRSYTNVPGRGELDDMYRYSVTSGNNIATFSSLEEADDLRASIKQELLDRGDLRR